MTDIDTARFRDAATAARKAQHHFPADCLMEAADTIDVLRAELDQAAYDRDCAREAGLVYQRQFDALRAENARLRAKLAAVEALCDRTSTPGSGFRQLADHHAKLTVEEIRRAMKEPA